MADKSFRIGPVDRLLKLTSPDEEVPATPARVGATTRSLNGIGTVQTFGFKRAWDLTFKYLDEEELADLEAFYREDIQGPYRLFDPMRKNLLNREVSAPSSTSEGVGLTASTAANATLKLGQIIPELSPTSRTTRKLNVVSTAANDLRRSEGKAWDAFVVGDPLTFSCWVDNISGAAPTPYIQFKDRTGANVGTRFTGTATSATGYGRVTVTATPPGGARFVEVGLNSSAANEFDTTGWQLEYGSTATAWVPGYGVPVVAVDSLELGYPIFGKYNVRINVQEV